MITSYVLVMLLKLHYLLRFCFGLVLVHDFSNHLSVAHVLQTMARSTHLFVYLVSTANAETKQQFVIKPRHIRRVRTFRSPDRPWQLKIMSGKSKQNHKFIPCIHNEQLAI